MTCEECKEQRREAAPVSFIAHESAMARAERTIKRLWITILLLIVMLVGTNGAWLWYESQFEYVETSQEVTQEAESGTNTFIGGDCYGETDGENNN